MAYIDSLPDEQDSYSITALNGGLMLALRSPITKPQRPQKDPADVIVVLTSWIADHTGNIFELQESLAIPNGPLGQGFRKVKFVLAYEFDEIFEGYHLLFRVRNPPNTAYIWSYDKPITQLTDEISIEAGKNALAQLNDARGTTLPYGWVLLDGEVVSSIITRAEFQFWYVLP